MSTQELGVVRPSELCIVRPGLEPDYTFLGSLPEALSDRLWIKVYDFGLRSDGSRQTVSVFGGEHAHRTRDNPAYQDQLFEATNRAWEQISSLTGVPDHKGNTTFPYLIVLTEGRIRKPDPALSLQEVFRSESGELGLFEALARHCGVPDEDFRVPEPDNALWRYLTYFYGPSTVNAYLGLRMYPQLIHAGLDSVQVMSGVLRTLHRRYSDFSFYPELAAGEQGVMGLQRAWERLYPGERPLHLMELGRLARLATEQTGSPFLRNIPDAERSDVQNLTIEANILRDICFINTIADLVAAGHDVAFAVSDTHGRAIDPALRELQRQYGAAA